MDARQRLNMPGNSALCLQFSTVSIPQVHKIQLMLTAEIIITEVRKSGYTYSFSFFSKSQ